LYALCDLAIAPTTVTVMASVAITIVAMSAASARRFVEMPTACMSTALCAIAAGVHERSDLPALPLVEALVQGLDRVGQLLQSGGPCRHGIGATAHALNQIGAVA
jgi:hypothetical protein